jgi:hypothetical protein
VGVPDQDEVDVLEREVRSSPLPARTLRIALVVVLVLAAGAWSIDRNVRESESAALSACASEAEDSATWAQGRVSSMAFYVRPALEAKPTIQRRDDIYRMVSQAAAGGRDDVAEALGTCRDVDVLVLHGSLRARKNECLSMLSETARFLDIVTANGRDLFLGLDVPYPTTC